MSTKDILVYIGIVIIMGSLYTGCILLCGKGESNYQREVLRRREAGDTTIVIRNGKADTTITIHK